MYNGAGVMIESMPKSFSEALQRDFEELERQLFDAIAAQTCDSKRPKMDAVFVVGAPRTGSTLTYQAICSQFDLPYIANLTNDRFSSTPIIGLTLQKAMPTEIAFASRFGKTDGPFQPSEGSALMVHWFGNGDPPALKAAEFRPGLEEHFTKTLRSAASLFGAPLVIKNAWNCYRMDTLARALPTARFVWIRRDIADAAKSDLNARYKTKGNATTWNSAKPVNIDELTQLSPAGQVVENQYAFNRTIRNSLQQIGAGLSIEIWYEDFQRDPERELSRVGQLLGLDASRASQKIKIMPGRFWELDQAEAQLIDSYVAHHRYRLAPDRYGFQT